MPSIDVNYEYKKGIAEMRYNRYEQMIDLTVNKLREHAIRNGNEPVMAHNYKLRIAAVNIIRDRYGIDQVVDPNNNQVIYNSD